MSAIKLVGVSHDLQKKRSLALFVWDNDTEKKISVPIPFGCSMERVGEVGEKAIRELANEIATIKVVLD